MGRPPEENMVEVKVAIPDKDRKVGAMIKALAVEVSGFKSVKGTTKEFLKASGFYVFRFRTQGKADEFSDSVRRYIPKGFAQIT